mmetsp:Transcript_4560/g.28915  ORF Transcript_4560/g.28915 Transcript_4560/m.28915 type:complete len:216 (-) Transcript_4560:159-806(-)
MLHTPERIRHSSGVSLCIKTEVGCAGIATRSRSTLYVVLSFAVPLDLKQLHLETELPSRHQIIAVQDDALVHHVQDHGLVSIRQFHQRVWPQVSLFVAHFSIVPVPSAQALDLFVIDWDVEHEFSSPLATLGLHKRSISHLQTLHSIVESLEQCVSHDVSGSNFELERFFFAGRVQDHVFFGLANVADGHDVSLFGHSWSRRGLGRGGKHPHASR